MTTSQRIRFYFPAWRTCSRALGWQMVQGRLLADLDAQRSELISSPAREERVKVIDMARGLAARYHRAVIAEDLRHGCNHTASGGRTFSSSQLDNKAVTRAVRLFQLLANPDDLDAVMLWMNPAEADRRDYAEWLSRAVPEATLIAISRNAWDTRDWKSQSLDSLRWLARTAKAGQDSRREAVRGRGRGREAICPF